MSEKCDTEDLVDIRTIKIDRDLPQQNRIIEYIRQIKDPYHFKYKKFKITACFAERGPSLEDCLQRMMD